MLNYKNSYYVKYVDLLMKKFSNGDIYTNINEKYNFNLENGKICIDYMYKENDKYFYLNFSYTPRSWYNYDRTTGKCNDKKRTKLLFVE